MTVTIHLTNGSLASAPNETDEPPEVVLVELDGEVVHSVPDLNNFRALERAVQDFLRKRPRQR